MKKFLALFLVLISTYASIAQNVGIGTTAPNASAQLDVSSTNTGFLPPRMTYAQRNAIVNPAAGLIVYCTDCANGEMQFYNGASWINMSVGIGSAPIINLPSVTIGAQVWTTQNLNVSTYRDGTPIPKVEDAATWGSLTTGAYCYYNNDSATYATVYGKLYNWYAVTGIYDSSSLSDLSLRKNLAPTGYHIPSDGEWITLTTTLGGESLAGGKMKEVGTTYWTTPNTGATNSSGFAGLPGGYRANSFYHIGFYGHWWSSTETNAINASFCFLNFENSLIYRFNDASKAVGFSVRCVKD